MADVYNGPFGEYDDVTGVVDATAKSEIAAMLVSLQELLPIPTWQTPESSQSAASPDFDQIPPHTSDKLHNEVAALAAAIAAAPGA